MSDNTELNVGTGGDVVRDLARETSPGVAGTAKTQVVALDAGGSSRNGEVLVGPGAPLPTAETNANADTPLSVSIIGDANGDFAGINLLEQVMDDGSGLSFSVKVVNQPRVDAKGATVISDGVPFTLSASTSGGSTAAIDTSGYNSIHLYAPSGFTSNAQFSNDGVNWTAVQGVLISTASLPNTTISGSGNWSIPVVGKYFRLTSVTASVVITGWLRTAPYNPLAQTTSAVASTGINIVSVGGSAAAGVSGALGVTGTQSNGGTTTASGVFPLVVGGSDVVTQPSSFAVAQLRPRFAAVDQFGDFIIVGPPPLTIPPQATALTVTNAQMMAPRPVAVRIVDGDADSEDGIGATLVQIKQLLGAMYVLLQELPLALNSGRSGGSVDDFSTFRDDPTFLKN